MKKSRQKVSSLSLSLFLSLSLSHLAALSGFASKQEKRERKDDENVVIFTVYQFMAAGRVREMVHTKKKKKETNKSYLTPTDPFY